MRGRWGLAFVLWVASASPAQDKPDAPPGGPGRPSATARPAPTIGADGRIVRGRDEEQRIAAAVARGVARLKRALAADASSPERQHLDGSTSALAYVTLRACGFPRGDEATSRSWRRTAERYDRGRLTTDAASLHLLAIAEHGAEVTGASNGRDVSLAPPDRARAEEIAGDLVAAQCACGGWGPAWPGARAPSTGAADDDCDPSSTHSALLGLATAARAGIAVDPLVWSRALRRLLTTQEPFGPLVRRRPIDLPRRRPGNGAASDTPGTQVDSARGWGPGAAPATPNADANVTMTADGVSSVVICRSELAGSTAVGAALVAEAEPSARDGLAWIGSHWEPAVASRWTVLTRGHGAAGPGGPRQLATPTAPDLAFRRSAAVYTPAEYLAVARAAVLADVEWLAETDWYGEAAEHLVETQDADGSWSLAGWTWVLPAEDATDRWTARNVAETCLALLFLRKGTTPVRRGAVTESGGTSDIRFDQAAALSDGDFGDLLDLVLLRWNWTPSEDARRRLFDEATSLGPRIVPRLLTRMDAPSLAVRTAAGALLARATGLEFGYDPRADSQVRESVVWKWQAWWLEAKETLRYDAERKRLVR